jgi:aminoglycoside/choline kinase family phosphotransferase
MDLHVDDLYQWCLQTLAVEPSDVAAELEMVSGDASFRRYYRLHRKNGASVIAVHAPPDKEDNAAFAAVQALLDKHGARVPALLGWDKPRGFLLQEDFGDQLLWPLLVNSAAADHYYKQAFRVLLTMQAIPADQHNLPHYDRKRLTAEMALLPEWFVGGLLGYELDESEYAMLNKVFDQLCERALAQSQVLLHRDFHSRNLMVLADERLGMIDFQDAVVGPVSYDLVSLIRDCYISWPEELVEDWIGVFYQQASRAGVLAGRSENDFAQDVDWMGLQRHIKVLGIFARLNLRDGKTAYMADLSLVLAYTLSIARRYPEFEEFVSWIEVKILPLIRKQPWYEEIHL